MEDWLLVVIVAEMCQLPQLVIDAFVVSSSEQQDCCKVMTVAFVVVEAWHYYFVASSAAALHYCLEKPGCMAEIDTVIE